MCKKGVFDEGFKNGEPARKEQIPRQLAVLQATTSVASTQSAGAKPSTTPTALV